MNEMVIGVDPGVTTGIALWDNSGADWEYAQCSPEMARMLIHELVLSFPWATVAVEKFVVGPRAGKTAKVSDVRTTQELIAYVKDLVEGLGPRLVVRPASAVKPWATDERLKAAGATTTMRHAKDAARHALFAAVDLGLRKDPLSTGG